MYLQGHLKLEAIRDEMKAQNIDLSSVEKFKIAIEDFIEEFRAKCERKNSN